MKKKFTRMSFYTLTIFVIFALIVSRAFFLQVVSGDYYKGIAEAMTETAISEIPTRGEIMDRNGVKIASNIQSYNITYSLSTKKRTDDEINKALIETVKVLYDFGDKEKINIDNLPIVYDASKNIFSFNFNSKNPDAVNKLADKFKEANNIDKSLNPEQTFYKFAEKYGLISGSEKSSFQNVYNISTDIMHKAVALRLAIKSISYKQYEPVYIAKNVKRQTAFKIQSESSYLEGVTSEIAPLRYYPFGQVGSNFIGYVGKISENAEDYSNMGYDVSNELIGKDGLEKILEDNLEMDIHLRGEPGVKYVQVDKFGKIIKQTAWLDSIPGDTIVTTIDMELQRVAEEAFDRMMQDIREGVYSKKDSYPNANRGALVVLDVNTGEILALVSRPGYDPNLFAATGGVDTDTYNSLFLPDLKDAYDKIPKPMFNYATQGTAPPGSTFKPLTAIAGLQEGVIKPLAIIHDYGIYTGVNGFKGKCWITESGTTHGDVNVSKALQVSCNYYFFEVGKRLGYEKLGEWAAKFGLARDPSTNTRPSTGIEIYERTGTVGSPITYKTRWIGSAMKKIAEAIAQPSNGGYILTEGTEEYNAIKGMMMDGYTMYDESKLKGIAGEKERRNYITRDYRSRLEKLGITSSKTQNIILVGKQDSNGEILVPGIKIFDSQASRPGDALNTAIGQGATSLTPLQMAHYLATLLNGGTRYKAHLVMKVLNADGTLKKEIEPEILNKIDLNPEFVEEIKKGMRKVTEEGGTASNIFRNYPIETGGKTGTAQWSDSTDFQKQSGRAAYGWFVGFAPYEKPEIVVAAVVYDGGHGNYVAHAVKDVFDQYFKLNK